jgi:hypothetical protein
VYAGDSRYIMIERLRIRASHPILTFARLPILLCRIGLVLAACCLAGGLGGCGLDDVVICKPPQDCDGPPAAQYPPRTTPRQAVEYLRLAWEERDSSRADTVYTDDYQGTSVDQMDPTPSTLNFAKSDEVRAVGGLQLDRKITNVSMTFQDSTQWEVVSYPGEPSDWVAVIVRNNPYIYITNSEGNDLKVEGSERFEFRTKPVTTGGKTLWQIVRWTELHTSAPD